MILENARAPEREATGVFPNRGQLENTRKNKLVHVYSAAGLHRHTKVDVAL
jgi:hypothetical protein